MVIAGVSHKGGTGRSVSIANLSFQLFKRGKKVLIVDMDFASPTMGAILGLGPSYALGAAARQNPDDSPKTVNEMLIEEEYETREALINVNRVSPLVSKYNQAGRRFDFLPALYADGDQVTTDNGDMENFARTVGKFISNIRSENRWDFVFLDVRSGLSSVLDAIGDPQNTLLDIMLIHFRWTSQHVTSLGQMLMDERLKRLAREKIKLVRTAYARPEIFDKPSLIDFIRQQNKELSKSFENTKFFGDNIDLSDLLIGDIMFDERLRWSEQILDNDIDKDFACAQSNYSEMATKLLALSGN